MIADVADSIAAHMTDCGDLSDAVLRKEERDPTIDRVVEHISRYTRRSKLIEFLWIEKHSNVLKQVEFMRH
jgi:hypothetical protein